MGSDHGAPTIPLQFTKMHGCGNDYIYFDAFSGKFPADFSESLLSELARQVSDVHTGIGADGMVIIMRSEVADARMRMFNADGSEAQMCGNASRCVAKYLYDNHLIRLSSISLETLAGIKLLTPHVDPATGLVSSVTVDMGAPEFEAAKVPVVSPTPTLIDDPVTVDGRTLRISAVSMGNPHGVVVVPEIDDELVLRVGPKLECHEMWPQKANIEFVKVLSPTEVEMRVWERGTGETMACGTGACAVSAVCNELGLCHSPLRVHLRGGDLSIELCKKSGHVLMTGPATLVCNGTYYLELTHRSEP